MDNSSLSEDQISALKRYRRLWVARNDLAEVNEAINQILNAHLRKPRAGERNPFLVVLTSALVISYGRPFVNTRGQATTAERVIPGTILRVLTKSERQLHEKLIDMRNHEVAHSDVEFLELELTFLPGGDIGISRLPRDPLYRSELYKLQRIIFKLDNEIDKVCSEFRKILPLGVPL